MLKLAVELVTIFAAEQVAELTFDVVPYTGIGRPYVVAGGGVERRFPQELSGDCRQRC